ncbi:MAG: hypothetical protein VX642_10060 [Bdellovibrionota bacterium]|nr:hypothetical protein [Bdellovibrionota bacterium]
MNKQRPEDFMFLIHPHMKEEEEAFKESDFRRMEERIQMAEEMIETWKGEMVDRAKKQDCQFLKVAFNELNDLSELVDELYAEWIHMDESSPDQSVSMGRKQDRSSH